MKLTNNTLCSITKERINLVGQFIALQPEQVETSATAGILNFVFDSCPFHTKIIIFTISSQERVKHWLKDNSTMYKSEAQIVSYGISH